MRSGLLGEIVCLLLLGDASFLGSTGERTVRTNDIKAEMKEV